MTTSNLRDGPWKISVQILQAHYDVSASMKGNPREAYGIPYIRIESSDRPQKSSLQSKVASNDCYVIEI